MAITRKKTTKPTAEKHESKAFVNWVVKNADGSIALKSSKGFPLQGHPDYPNKHEDALIALAEKHGGSVQLVMHVSVNLNTKGADIDLESIPVIEKAA